MYKKIWISATSIVSVIALGAGATFALLTSNTATIAANSLTTGSAEIKICNELGVGQWGGSVSPSLTLSNLVPGADEQELSSTAQIYIGNDNGSLNTSQTSPICDSYGANPLGSSDVDLQMIPVVSNVVCAQPVLENQFMVKFDIDGNTVGPLTLTDAKTNTTAINMTLIPGQSGRVKVFASLDESATDQNANCTFNIDFQGKQPEVI